MGHGGARLRGALVQACRLTALGSAGRHGSEGVVEGQAVPAALHLDVVLPRVGHLELGDLLFDLARAVALDLWLPGDPRPVVLRDLLVLPLERPAVGLLRGVAQVQVLVEHVLLVLQVQLRVGVGDEVKLPGEQEVVQVEVVGPQIQLLFSWGR